MRFPLAVVAEVARVAATAGRSFIIGYRISPEEPEIGGLRLAAPPVGGVALVGLLPGMCLVPLNNSPSHIADRSVR